MKRLLVAFGAFLVSSLSLPAQGQSQKGPSDQTASSTIRSTAQEVMLDMVFRDRKGKTIRDIRPEEIHVLEDGTEQTLNSLRLLEGNSVRYLNQPGAAVPESGAPPVDPMRE